MDMFESFCNLAELSEDAGEKNDHHLRGSAYERFSVCVRIVFEIIGDVAP